MDDFVVPGFVVEQQLHGSASGLVYAAYEESSGRPVALMRLRLDAGFDRERLKQQAATLARLSHPHLRALLGLAETADDVVLVLEPAEGGSLAEILELRGVLSPGEVVTACAPIAQALEAVHRRGLVHGDVIPENMVFALDGRPMLSFLGISNLVGAAPGNPWADPDFLAPEVGHGYPPTPASDVYGLAAVAVSALLGSPQAVRQLYQLGVDPRTAATLERALDLDPNRRPSATDLVNDLFALAPPEPVLLPEVWEEDGAEDPGYDQPPPMQHQPMQPPTQPPPMQYQPLQPPMLPPLQPPPLQPPPMQYQPMQPPTQPQPMQPPPMESAATQTSTWAGAGVAGAATGSLPSVPPGQQPSSADPPTAAHDPFAVSESHRGQDNDRSSTKPSRRSGRARSQPPPDKPASSQRSRRSSGRRFWWVVLVLLIIVLLVGGAVWAAPRLLDLVRGDGDGSAGAVATTTLSTEEARQEATELCGAAPAPSQPPADPADWQTVIEGLYEIRARAFAELDPKLLCDVYASTSNGLVSDIQRLSTYQDAGVKVDGMSFTVQSAALVGRDGSRVYLEISDSIPAYRLVAKDGTTLTEVEGVEQASWRAELVPAPDGQSWLFG